MSIRHRSAALEERKTSARILRHETIWQFAETARSPRARKVRPWQVVHACDFARDIADVVEAQIAAGMRPYLLTVGVDLVPKASVLQTWQDVRRWKKAFDESGAQTTPQLIHAHSFASGMAAVRMGACTVYDLRLTIEDRLAAAGDGAAEPPGAWLARSFRTAEQFVLTRTAAVVVHSPALREECISRGVAPQSVFVVPVPVPMEDENNSVDFSGLTRDPERELRSPQRIAEKYDDVYRYAFSRRGKKSGSGDSSGALIPIQANL